MTSSSGTTFVARDDMIDAARGMMMANLWHYERYGEFPTLTQMAQRDSWRGAAMRREAREFLIDNDYVRVEGDRTVELTPKGLIWLTPPKLEPESQPSWRDLPGDDELFDTLMYVENFVQRRGRWPLPTDLKGAGIRRRIGPEAFTAALGALVDAGQIARVSLRNGDRSLTYTVSIRWCPGVRGKHGLTFWWPSSNGPLPED